MLIALFPDFILKCLGEKMSAFKKVFQGVHLLCYFNFCILLWNLQETKGCHILQRSLAGIRKVEHGPYEH